jgi:beta-phosphoglucomutase-like phosphatase (HAD superfamily)
MSMLRPDACLFDLDGLLLDTEPLHGRAWAQAASHFGARLNDAELLQLRGRRRLDCAEQLRHWISNRCLNAPSCEDLLAIRQPIAEALMLQAPAIPGARALLERCAALKIPMALATSSSSTAAHAPRGSGAPNTARASAASRSAVSAGSESPDLVVGKAYHAQWSYLR